MLLVSQLGSETTYSVAQPQRRATVASPGKHEGQNCRLTAPGAFGVDQRLDRVGVAALRLAHGFSDTNCFRDGV
jgi:hypothetical protein